MEPSAFRTLDLTRRFFSPGVPSNPLESSPVLEIFWKRSDRDFALKKPGRQNQPTTGLLCKASDADCYFNSSSFFDRAVPLCSMRAKYTPDDTAASASDRPPQCVAYEPASCSPLTSEATRNQ